MALTTLSPSRVDAHRLRDMSGASSAELGSSDVPVESKLGSPFKCDCAWVESRPSLAGGEL